MRDCSAGLAIDIAKEATTLCRLWKVTRKDGTILRFTDATEDVTIAADGTYVSNISFTCSAIFTSSALQNSQNLTITFMMDEDGVTETDVRQKLYEAADCAIYFANYEDPSHGVMTAFRGTFGKIKITDKNCAQIDVTPLAGALSGRMIGVEVYSQTCRASLGDARCGFDIEGAKVTFTVTSFSGSVVDATEFTGPDPNYFAQGFVKWLTGDNTGTTSMVTTNDGSGSITLSAQPGRTIQVGDTGDIFPGCDKVASTCRDKFDRIPFMRAEPFVPGQDVLPPVPVATSGIGIGGGYSR